MISYVDQLTPATTKDVFEGKLYVRWVVEWWRTAHCLQRRDKLASGTDCVVDGSVLVKPAAAWHCGYTIQTDQATYPAMHAPGGGVRGRGGKQSGRRGHGSATSICESSTLDYQGPTTESVIVTQLHAKLAVTYCFYVLRRVGFPSGGKGGYGPQGFSPKVGWICLFPSLAMLWFYVPDQTTEPTFNSLFLDCTALISFLKSWRTETFWS